MRAWLDGKEATIRRPELVRDFVHVDYLAAAYARLCRDVVAGRGMLSSAPTGHVGCLLELARLLAPSSHLASDCGATSWRLRSTVSSPSRVSVATPTSIAPLMRDWPFERSWDRLAEFYRG